MGQLYIPAKVKISGPWFLGKKELEELDTILDQVEIDINKSADVLHDEEAKEDVQKGYAKSFEEALEKIKDRRKKDAKRKVTLMSSDESKLIDNSILGILKDSKLKDFHPKELRVDISNGYSNQFSLEVDRRYDGELTYTITCTSQEFQEEIKYKIDNWIEKYKPNKAKQIWNRYAFILGTLGFLFLFYSSFYFINSSPSAKEYYKAETNTLIKTGINDTNQVKAIELLLKMSSDYTPENLKDGLSKNTFFKISAIFLVTLLLSIFYPKTTMGVGKHQNLLKIYRFYTNFIIVTIPSAIIIPPVVQWARSIIIS